MTCESMSARDGSPSPARRHRPGGANEQGQLRDALTAMEQTIGVIGHELRTPLSGIRMLSEYLMGEGLPTPTRTLVGSIHDEVVRLSTFVNNMLEAARLNSGAARWKWGHVDLTGVCADAMTVIRPLIDEQRVELVCECKGAILMRGDGEALVRLIVNLLSNAQRHTQRGTIRLEASAIRGGGWAEVLVSDTGCGICDEVDGRLGEPFALNTGVAGSAGSKGTGLGLAICKGIAAAHGGSIALTSAPGRGTAVIVRLRTDLSQAVDVQPKDNLSYEAAA